MVDGINMPLIDDCIIFSIFVFCRSAFLSFCLSAFLSIFLSYLIFALLCSLEFTCKPTECFLLSFRLSVFLSFRHAHWVYNCVFQFYGLRVIFYQLCDCNPSVYFSIHPSIFIFISYFLCLFLLHLFSCPGQLNR